TKCERKYTAIVANREELANVQGNKPLRNHVRILCPIEIWHTNELDLRLVLELHSAIENLIPKSSSKHHVTLHRVDLYRLGTQENPWPNHDVLVSCSKAVRSSLQVYHPDNYFAGPFQISAASIDPSGQYAATLSFTQSDCYLVLWQLNKTKTPEGWLKFPIERDGKDTPPNLNVTLAPGASQIVVYPASKPVHGLGGLFQVFEFSPSTSVGTTCDTSKNIQHSDKFRADKWLQDFYGAAKFHSSFEFKSGNNTNYFVACNGFDIAVYDTRGSWLQRSRMVLAAIAPSEMSEFEKVDDEKVEGKIRANAAKVIDSLRGPYFAWPDKLFFSVYNLAECTTIAHIPNRVQFQSSANQVLHVSFSSDGTMMAVTEEYCVSTYMTESATLVARREFSDSPLIRAHFINKGHQLLIQFKDARYAVVDPVHITNHISKNVKRINLPVTSVVQNQVLAVQKEGQSTLDIDDLIYITQGSTITVYDLQQCIQSVAYEDSRDCHNGCKRGQSGPPENSSKQCTANGCDYELHVISHNLPRDQVKVVLLMYRPSDDPTHELQELQRVALHEERRTSSQDETPDGKRHSGGVRPGVLEDAYFLDCRTRYVIRCKKYIQVWSLPTKDSGRCKLLLMVNNPGSQTYICAMHSAIYNLGRHEDYSFHADDLRDPKQVHACIDSLHLIITSYQDAEENHRQGLLRYVLRYINHCVAGTTSAHRTVIDEIIRLSKEKGQWNNTCNQFLQDLLSTFSKDGTHWIPRSEQQLECDPISTVIKDQSHPECLPLAVTLIDYCAQKARDNKDIGYLALVYQALPCIIEMQPNLVQDILDKSAFIPVKNNNLYPKRNFVVNNPLVRYRPRLSNLFGKGDRWTILSNRESVFQLQSMLPPYRLIKPRNDDERLNEGFRSEVYAVPFSLLWHPKRKGHAKLVQESAWWKSMLIAICWKISPIAPNVIQAHKFEQEHLDNPAIEALLEYKWNTFVSKYWTTRFSLQCVYYLMVLTVGFVQIFGTHPSELEELFVAIIAFAAMFLWFEIQQLIKGWGRYVRSPYNFVDMFAYLVPMLASIWQKLELQYGDTLESGQRRNSITVFGFGILAVYIHLLFELRVRESVCKIVAILLNITYRIKIFFFIFFACVFAFSHAFLYLLWARVTNGESQSPYEEDFPRHFGSSLTITYFMIGGRYDPMDAMFKTGGGGFQIMMCIYFFITGILMLNVLIALINDAFMTGESVWKLVWLESRLRFVESAENMAYTIPGFRRAHNWFPNEIYYTATPNDISEFEERVKSNATKNAKVLIGSSTNETQLSDIALLLQRPLEELLDASLTERTAPVTVAPRGLRTPVPSITPIYAGRALRNLTSSPLSAMHFRSESTQSNIENSNIGMTGRRPDNSDGSGNATTTTSAEMDELRKEQSELVTRFDALQRQLEEDAQQRQELKSQMESLIAMLGGRFTESPSSIHTRIG
ncbi:hypothetical protein BGZ94_000531, partial [Podila epigama]